MWAFIHALGSCPFSQVRLISSRSLDLPVFPRCQSISLCILSGPGDFLGFVLFSAYSSSERVNAVSRCVFGGHNFSSRFSSFRRGWSLSGSFFNLLVVAKCLLKDSALFWGFHPLLSAWCWFFSCSLRDCLTASMPWFHLCGDLGSSRCQSICVSMQ